MSVWRQLPTNDDAVSAHVVGEDVTLLEGKENTGRMASMAATRGALRFFTGESSSEEAGDSAAPRRRSAFQSSSAPLPHFQPGSCFGPTVKGQVRDTLEACEGHLQRVAGEEFRRFIGFQLDCVAGYHKGFPHRPFIRPGAGDCPIQS